MTPEPTGQVMQAPSRLYLRLEDAAEYALVSMSTIRRAARRASSDPCWLKTVGEKGFRRTTHEWVDDWLERCARYDEEHGK